jgi:cobalt-precorrin 5A hydrolase
MDADTMRVAIIAITKGGLKLSTKLCRLLHFESVPSGPEGIQATVKNIWPDYDAIIFIMATGIVIRAIAPLLQDKNSDPCIIALDEGGSFAISLLAGHIGGGNALTNEVAKAIGATPVITTASDVLGLTALDLWAQHNNLVASGKELTQLSSLLVNNGTLRVMTDFPGELPADFKQVHALENADLLIDHRKRSASTPLVTMQPKALVVGIGCNRGTGCDEIDSAVRSTCEQNGLAFAAIASLASIDLKGDEAGLLAFADRYQLPLFFYTAVQLNSIEGIKQSATVFAATGAYAVCEPAALLQAETETLLVEKTKWKNVTIAMAAKSVKLSAKYT